MKTNELNSSEELSFQQKLWKGTGTFLYAVRPLVLYSVLPACLMILGMVLLPWDRTEDEMISGSGNFYYALGIILTVFLLHKRSKKRGSSLEADATLEYRGLDRRKIVLLLGMGFGFGFFFSALVTVVPFPQVLMESYDSSSDALNHGTDPWLALLATTVLAPVTEEIVFRGYMLNRLLGWFKEREGVLIVSLVFALCHVSPIWVVYAFLMGMLLGRVSVVEDNIAYSIALHIGFNMNVLPIWLINRSPRLNAALFSDHKLVAVYGAASCLIGVWLLGKYRRETKIW